MDELRYRWLVTRVDDTGKALAQADVLGLTEFEMVGLFRDRQKFPEGQYVLEKLSQVWVINAVGEDPVDYERVFGDVEVETPDIDPDFHPQSWQTQHAASEING